MNPASLAASLLDEVATWPGVGTKTTLRGASAIVFEGHELGHVHSDRGTLYRHFPMREALIGATIPDMGNPDSPLYGRYLVVDEATTAVLDRLAVDEALRPGVDTLTVCRLVGVVAIVADQGGLDAPTVRSLFAIVANGLLR